MPFDGSPLWKECRDKRQDTLSFAPDGVSYPTFDGRYEDIVDREGKSLSW